MATNHNRAGYKLPAKPESDGGKRAQGFVTPRQDRAPQVHTIPPRRVLPIIFIPGIMGSNLRVTADRQAELRRDNNLAWRPDDLIETVRMAGHSARERQMRLDPYKTELDVYDPVANLTGDPQETSNSRNKSATFSSQYGGSWKILNGPLLQSDRAGLKGGKTRDQKARERGWGEVFFGSYEEILSACEIRLNGAFSHRFKDTYLMESIVGVKPSEWGAHPNPPMVEMDEETLREAIKGCWFPVHAMGYNWLRGNKESGIVIAGRIKDLIKSYQGQGYQCEKVILVTHSMGGLVARAVIHPDMGAGKDQVLGVIHGAMPAIGAGAAYKRMRCGFEGSGKATEILGAIGSHVTPVLGNSQGGLELLPTQAYGNGWLQIAHEKKVIREFPKEGDPYEEIYKVSNKWYGLLRKDWLNPARSTRVSMEESFRLLDRARNFHAQIQGTYHDQSYAHYGDDLEGLTWRNVVWSVDSDLDSAEVDSLLISSDNEMGALKLKLSKSRSKKAGEEKAIISRLLPPIDPGDQTVPTHSADAQLRSGKFKGIFRQSGYEHQASYSNEAVIASTIYCLYKIVSTMHWSEK